MRPSAEPPIEPAPDGRPPEELPIEAVGPGGLVRRWIWGFDVFVSYTRGDGAGIAATLEEELERAGLRVFRDASRLESGDPLRLTLARAIRQSTTVVVVVTPGAIGHVWVNAEVAHAVRIGRNVVPLVCGVPTTTGTSAVARILHERIRIERPVAPFVDADTVARIVGSLGAVRQQQRRAAAMTLFASTMLLLALAATFAAGAAYTQWKRAVAEARVTQAQGLAARSSAAGLADAPLTAVSLAARAVRVRWDAGETVPAEAEKSLRDALGNVGGAGRAFSDEPIERVWALADGQVVARDRAWRVRRWPAAGSVTAGEAVPLDGLDVDDTIQPFREGLVQQLPGGEIHRWRFSQASPSGGPAVGAVLSVDPDGTLLVTQEGADIAVRDLTAPALERVATVPGCGEGPLSAWSAQGGHLAVLGAAASWIFRSDTHAVATLGPPPEAPEQLVRVAVSEQGDRLAALSQAGTLWIWGPSEEARSLSLFPEEGVVSADWEHQLAFSPDGRWILVANGTSEVALVRVGETLRAETLYRFDANGDPLLPSGAPPFAFTADARVLFVVDYAGRIQVWSLRDDDAVRVTALTGHDGGTTALVLAPDGALLSGGLDGTLRRWEAPPQADPASTGRWDLARAQWRAAPIEIRGERGAFADGFSTFAAAVGGDGWVVSEGTAHAPRLSRVGRDGQVERSVPLRHPLRWSRHGRWVVSGGGAAPAEVVRLEDGVRAPLPAGEVVAVDEDGDTVVIAAEGGLGVADVSATPPRFARVAPPAPEWRLADVATSPGRLLWHHAAGWSVTDRATGAIVGEGTAHGVAFCLEGAAVCDADTVVRIAGGARVPLRVDGRDLVRDARACLSQADGTEASIHRALAAAPVSIGMPAVVALACADGGADLAVGTLSGEVGWIRSGGPLRRARVGDHPIKQLAWLPGGAGLLVATARATVLTWPEGDPRTVRLPGGVEIDVGTAVSPDGAWLAVGGDDQVLRMHPARIEDLLARARVVLGNVEP